MSYILSYEKRSELGRPRKTLNEVIVRDFLVVDVI